MSFTFAGRAALRVAVAARATSFFGDQVATVALVLRLQADGSGAFAVAGLLMAGLAPIALLAPVAGRLVDRRGSRGLLVGSGAVQAAVCTGLVFASGPPATLALVAALGAGQAVNGATWQALIPALVEADELPRAMSLAQAANTIALMAAPAAGGLLTEWAGTTPAIALNAASFVVVAAVGALVPNRTTALGAGPLPGGWSIVRADALLRPAVLLFGLFILLGSMVNVVDVFFVRETLGAGPAWYGLVGAGYAVGLLAGSLAAGRVRGMASLARVFVAGAALLGAGLAAMGLSPTVVVLLAASTVTGAFNGALNVATSALIYGRAAAQARGRVAALVGGVGSGAQLAAYAAGGALAGPLGPRTVFVAAGVLGALVPLLAARQVLQAAAPAVGASPADQALFSRRSRLGVSRGTSVG